MKLKHEWIRDGLTRRGYRQKDLAIAWSSQQASVSRFLQGEELQDLPLSKAVSLARMLGITVDELAKGLGVNGVIVEPSVEETIRSSVPLGTVNFSTPRAGVARIEMRRDFDVKVAREIIALVAGDTLLGADMPLSASGEER